MKAYSLTVDIVDLQTGEIHVTHTFWGETKAQVQARRREHEQGCEAFAAAVRDHRTIEDIEEIDEDELPCAEDEDDEEEEDDGR